MLFTALKEKHLSEDEVVDDVLLEALAACYENASHWNARIQIFSISADIHTMPEHIIKQYQSYCVETRFSTPLSRNSLCRILDACSVSTRSSLHDFDYFTAEGGKAFGEVVAVVEKLGKAYGLGLRWSKEHIKNLKRQSVF